MEQLARQKVSRLDWEVQLRDAMTKGNITAMTNKRNNRKEIDEFCQDPIALNLFLLALQELQDNTKDQAANLKSIWSWFGLGRIHGGVGMPHNNVSSSELYNLLKDNGQDWQSKAFRGNTLTIANTSPTKGDESKGYCTHGSILL